MTTQITIKKPKALNKYLDTLAFFDLQRCLHSDLKPSNKIDFQVVD